VRKREPNSQILASKETLARILAAYSISDFIFEPIDQGIENTSIRIEASGRKYVLRIYSQNRKKDEDTLFEINFQDQLREKGIPIPEIYKNAQGERLTIAEIDGKRWQAILMHCIEGSSTTRDPSAELIAELAQMQARMHVFGIEFAGTVDKPKRLWADLHDSLLQKITDMPREGTELRSLAERIAAFRYPLDPELPYGYNHLDIDLGGNVLTKENKVTGIVDFDDLAYSPSIICLGYTLWSILDEGGEGAVRSYLSEYEKIRPLTPLERETLPHAILFRNYVIGAVRLLLGEGHVPFADIERLIALEKEIPALAL
jgi:Ser/Thr protein kinase RdoA (MazF antagonist)